VELPGAAQRDRQGPITAAVASRAALNPGCGRPRPAGRPRRPRPARKTRAPHPCRKDTGDRLPLRRRSQAVSVDVATVCDQAFDPEPKRRYQRAADLVRDLENCLARREVEARVAR
jgi:hypothetical protein